MSVMTNNNGTIEIYDGPELELKTKPMETNNINFNQINFGRLEPNSLYAIKFPHYWQISTITSVIQKLNKAGKDYGVRFIPMLHDMEFVNGERLNE